jgi:hypothetical protein
MMFSLSRRFVIMPLSGNDAGDVFESVSMIYLPLLDKTTRII